MQKILDQETYKYVRFLGRTIDDADVGGVFFNWSGSGFEITFEGKRLDVYLSAKETVFPPEGTLWPWISVFLDEEESPAIETEINSSKKCITLFSSDTSEKHKIKVIKRSENDKGKVGILGFKMDGQLLPQGENEEKLKLEFIGDSITCGFGNEANSRDDLFLAKEENCELAYSAIAAKELGAEYSSICVSGISLCKPLDPDFRLTFPDIPDVAIEIRGMEDYYEYADRVYEETKGEKDFTAWNFSKFKPDAVIINLGTNDAYRIQLADNRAAEERHFELRYKDFIHKIRKNNGKEAVICCTLGSMDYYLYDNILRAVDEYKSETNDNNVVCYKYGSIVPEHEGVGAQNHPSVKTHIKMGKELSTMLKLWLADNDKLKQK